MAVEYLGTGNDDGVSLGRSSSDKIAFFGGTPTSRISGGTAAATTAAVSISATQWGFSTSTQANAIVTLVNNLRSQLVTMGLLT